MSGIVSFTPTRKYGRVLQWMKVCRSDTLPALKSSRAGSVLGYLYSAGSARGKIAVLTSLSFRKVEGKDRGGYVFCRGREGYSDARAKFP